MRCDGMKQTSPLQRLDMNPPLRSSLVTSPPSDVPAREELVENTVPIQRSRKRKAPKAVRFLPVVEIIPAPSPLDAVMREDETNAWKNDLWFSVEDLAEFRNTARDMCRQMRTTTTTETLDNESSVTTCSDPQMRGLEQRCCLERQRRKHIAIRFILKAASQVRAHPNPNKSPEERLAALAQKCNSWATLLAIEEAERDYRRAYCADEDGNESGDDCGTATASSMPLLQRRKRLTGERGGDALGKANTRRVRARLSLATNKVGVHC